MMDERLLLDMEEYLVSVARYLDARLFPDDRLLLTAQETLMRALGRRLIDRHERRAEQARVDRAATND